MSRSHLALLGIAALYAAGCSGSISGGSGGSGGTATTTTTTASTTKSVTATSESTSSSTTETGTGDAGDECQDPQNPLLTSCIVPFLAGCWAPDLSGTCSDQSGVLAWSDGYKYVHSGTMTGLYAPGATTPCITMVISGSTITGTKGSETLVYAFDTSSMTATITCPDTSKVTATSAQVTAFNMCHGLNCP
jgi:hypothetical protein